MPFAVYRAGQDARIKKALDKLGALIAYVPSVPDEIIGWVCGDGKTVQYVYVKQAYRRQGIGSELVKGCSQYAYETRAGRVFFASQGLTFNPYEVIA